MKKLFYALGLVILFVQFSTLVFSQTITTSSTVQTTGNLPDNLLAIYLSGCLAYLALAWITKLHKSRFSYKLLIGLGSWLAVAGLLIVLAMIVWVCIKDDHPYKASKDKQSKKGKLNDMVESILASRTIKNI